MIFATSETGTRFAFIAGVADAHGNEVESWSPGVAFGFWAFNPGGSNESRLPGHERVITEPTLYLPPNVVFSPRDRVTVRSVSYEVEGETAQWRHPNGTLAGNVATLRRVDG